MDADHPLDWTTFAFDLGIRLSGFSAGVPPGLPEELASMVKIGRSWAAVFLLLACSEPPVDAEPECDPGIVKNCRCTTGDYGRTQCNSEGFFAACDCSGTPSSADENAGASGNSDEVSGAATGDAGVHALGDASGPRDDARASGDPNGGAADDSEQFVTEPEDDAAYVFDQSRIHTYNIQIAPADLASINANPTAEAWVPATLEFEGTTYGPYQVRYKGSNGTFKYPCTTEGPGDPKAGKCSLKLGFDRLDEEGRFYGLRKLNFHSLNADPSLMRERLGYALFRENRIAAPRSMHARVLINGVLEGLFIAVEQVDGRFARARFADGGEGNVYKEAWPRESDANKYLAALETNKDEMPSVQRMLDFSAAIQSKMPFDAFITRSYLLRYLAVDRVTINDDGFLHFYCDTTAGGPGSNHNYYWYEGVDSGRLWLIPWDLDRGFDQTPWVHLEVPWNASAQCACVQIPNYGAQVAASCDMFVQRLITWRSDYESAIDEFVAGPFSRARVDAKLDAWSAQLRQYVSEAAGINLAPDEAAWATGLAELKSKIESARASGGYAY